MKCLFGILFLFALVEGCTYFEIPYGKKFVIGRTMELGGEFLENVWKIQAVPRGYKYPKFPVGGVGALEELHDLGSGLSNEMVMKYGFVGGTSGLKLGKIVSEIFVDGLNEKGLSASAHTHRNAVYQNLSLFASVHMQYIAFIPWVLGNFETVSEVETALKSGKYAFVGIPLVPKPLHAHFSVSDSKGNSVVIEFVKGKIQIHKNTVGVMTNDPEFEWHLYNLNQYVNLSPLNPSRSGDIGTVKTSIGHVPQTLSNGFNLHGLPADMGPPARFVRSFYFKEFIKYNHPPKTEQEAIIAANAMLNNVAIPLGTVAKQSISESMDFTQWAVIKIPSSGKFLFRSYNNMIWKSVNLKSMDSFFQNSSTLKTMHLFTDETGVQDVTEQLLV